MGANRQSTAPHYFYYIRPGNACQVVAGLLINGLINRSRRDFD
ncbi:hypothetical protein ANACOL_00230 [Anaerotruncus colihominis DSM 17241]|uniref:Uncharacterized protein n=1 Tax=Anaerotruncus colihominis DSM 17241 TaxID=445972 RepID=B0P658_9FIRM|nr:hypothetical protein ANACOL_00230 [Anaerotruncus colihominis DSM 17241]DAO20897.1 MAG TPA: hypothetical protein [Caudoviricetes sp.]